MNYILCIGSPQPHSTFDRSLAFEYVNYSGTSGHASDNGGAASDIEAYEKSYFAPAPNMIKHSHLRPE